MNLRKYKHFKPYEFNCCVPRCDINDMDADFLGVLDDARELAGVPFRLNSAYRSKDYELAKGRTGTSSHCKGVAVDIACSDSRKRYLIVQSLIAVGFMRIGINKTYIHVDADDDKRASIWLY